ncbi:MAG: peroxide stress protein YaaA [Alphaproteobacteria bacterium]|nr:peroxide stress protein YaaA [Alphaproteobacteria bacterium]
MLHLLSPSKTLDYETQYALKQYSQPQFLADSEKLVAKLRTLSPAQIGRMMELSDKLAALNAQRFKAFSTPFTPANARQALLAFKGDVYTPIDVAGYTKQDFAFAQSHMRVLSGLYGLLRPLDLIQPYRLEMGRKITIGKTGDLYGFWGARLAKSLNAELASHKTRLLVNLASEEYARAVDRKILKFPVIDMIFKEKKGDTLKIIGLFAKQARGAMANFIIKNQIDKPEGLRDFTGNGYRFDPKLSDASRMTFVRKTS